MAELQAELQRLSGTTLDAQGAANAWAGTTGLDLVGALNTEAGLARSDWLELAGVLNYLAGTDGLGVNAAAAAITAAPPAGIPTYVASSSAATGDAADSLTTTRPTGTAAGDHLFLVFHVANAETTPPTFTGWTKLSGFDTVASPKFAIYDRIADLTATDQPTINPTIAWYGGWAMVAIRGGSTISVPVTFTSAAAVNSMVGSSITTVAADSLILSIGMHGGTGAVSAPTGGPVDRYRANGNYYGVGVATEDKAAAGAGQVPTWAVAGGTVNVIVYVLALTA